MKIILILLMILPHFLLAQPIIVKGKITDYKMNPIPGVNIIIVGTQTGTIADLDGKYDLKVQKGTSQISFSLMGYKGITTSDINFVNGSYIINLILKSDPNDKFIKKEIKALEKANNQKELQEGYLSNSTYTLETSNNNSNNNTNCIARKYSRDQGEFVNSISWSGNCSNQGAEGYGTAKFANGDYYTGPMHNGYADNYGKLVSLGTRNTKFIYTGYWVNGKLEGETTITYEPAFNGIKYIIGISVNGLLEGEVLAYNSNGSVVAKGSSYHGDVEVTFISMSNSDASKFLVGLGAVLAAGYIIKSGIDGLSNYYSGQGYNYSSSSSSGTNSGSSGSSILSYPGIDEIYTGDDCDNGENTLGPWGKWQKCLVKFKDGVSGDLFYFFGCGKYGISTGFSEYAYDSKENALRALYNYKKNGKTQSEGYCGCED